MHHTGTNKDRTTSACAENTIQHHQGFIEVANYLRVRGEYKLREDPRVMRLELPPRARRILQVFLKLLDIHGTTSACAENTPKRTIRHHRQGNYLRVRGEYSRMIL